MKYGASTEQIGKAVKIRNEKKGKIRKEACKIVHSQDENEKNNPYTTDNYAHSDKAQAFINKQSEMKYGASTEQIGKAVKIRNENKGKICKEANKIVHSQDRNVKNNPYTTNNYAHSTKAQAFINKHSK